MIAVERRVQALHQLCACCSSGVFVAAEHDAVGPHEVFDRRAFFQELRVRDHRKCRLLRQRPSSSSAIAARTRSAVPTGTVDLSTITLKPFMCLPMLRAAADHVLQVGRAVFVRRRADRDELDIAVRDAGGDVGGKLQAARRCDCG